MRMHVGPVRNEIQTHHRHHPMRMKKKPPRGMYVDRDDLLAMATSQADAIFKGLDADLVTLKRQVRHINVREFFFTMEASTLEGVVE